MPRFIDAECHIIVPAGIGASSLHFLTGKEPPIPSDEEMEDTFPDWKAKGKIFCYRCLKEEGKDPIMVDAQDMFRYGMKFLICEAKKLA